jgi:hypothetical protein
MGKEEPLHPLQQGWTSGSHMLDTPSKDASQEGQKVGEPPMKQLN